MMITFYLSLLADESDRLNFEKLYREYGGIVLKYAVSFLHDQHDAEDIAHDTWVWVAEHFEKFQTLNEASVRNYIMKIVENKCNYFFRKQKRIANVVEGTVPEMPMKEYTETKEILLAVCEREDCRTIVANIKKLDARYRDVLNLFYLNDSSTKEIAEMLQITDSTVRQRLTRGRRMLIDLINEEGSNDEF